MKKTLAISMILLFLGCSQKIAEENLKLLNGYWEIKEVVLTDGSTKEYKVNTSVDYIQIENKKGFRKKVQPKFNGTYDTSNDADLFVIVEANGIFAINYSAENNDGLVQQRTEELIRLSEDGFTVRSADGLTYNYTRFEPINVNE